MLNEKEGYIPATARRSGIEIDQSELPSSRPLTSSAVVDQTGQVSNRGTNPSAIARADARFRVADVNSASADCSAAYRRSNHSPLRQSAAYSRSNHSPLRHSTHHSIRRSTHRSSQSYTNRDDESESEFYSDDDEDVVFRPGAYGIDSEGVDQHAKGSLTQHPHRRSFDEMELFPELLTLSRQSSPMAPSATERKSLRQLANEVAMESSPMAPSETERKSLRELENEVAMESSPMAPSETERKSLRELKNEVAIGELIGEAPVGDTALKDMDDEISASVAEPESVKKKKFYQQRWCWISVMLIAICAVGAGVGLASSSSSINTEQSAATNAPTTKLSDDVRLETMIGFLADVSTRQDLESSETAQNRAAQWLALEDPLQLSPETDKSSLIIERYLIALFYFATNERFDGFLGSDSVCSWNKNGKGAFCHDDNNTDSVSHIMVNQTLLQGYLPSELCRLESLVHLDLSQNLLTDLPDSIGDCSKLEYFNVGDNQGDLGRFPETLFTLTNLQVLQFYKGSIRAELPTTIGMLTNLKVLVLSFNNIFGSIPSELWELSSLEFLDLGRNDLSGSIPKGISNTNLTHLKLGRNILEFSIPPDILELTNLVQMDLSTNFLTGEIPRDLETLTNLVELDLRENFDLTGSVNGLCNSSAVDETNFYTYEEVSCTCCKIDS